MTIGQPLIVQQSEPANRVHGQYQRLQSTSPMVGASSSNVESRGDATASPLSHGQEFDAQTARQRANSRSLSSRWPERMPG